MLEVTDLDVSYGQIEAVRGVSLRVEEGQVVALIGANGAGKSTTLNAISGLHRPRSGSIKFRGEEISRWPPHRIVAAGVVQVPEGRAILAKNEREGLVSAATMLEAAEKAVELASGSGVSPVEDEGA